MSSTDSFGRSLCSQLLTDLTLLAAVVEGFWRKEGAKERLSNVCLQRPRLNCQRKMVAASTPHLLEPPHPPGFLLHSSQISLFWCFALSLFWFVPPRAWHKSWLKLKLIQFGKVSQLGNNWNREVPLLNWPPGNAFSRFDELNFRLDPSILLPLRNKGTINNLVLKWSRFSSREYWVAILMMVQLVYVPGWWLLVSLIWATTKLFARNCNFGIEKLRNNVF